MMLRIVYVDDEKELCEVFQEIFSTPEVSIETYSSPSKALEKILENPPDLIFMDYRMPEMNGLELARKCPGNIKKYLLTGENNLTLDFPFEAILSKPSNSKQIREIISNAK